MEGIVKEKE
jgi:hypothetical protein